MSTESTITDSDPIAATQDNADHPWADHLWLHFSRMSSYATTPVPTIERGDGAYIWDTNGRKYLDGLSGLFAVQVGHGRVELAEAAAAQARKLAFFPIWSFAHPTAIELSDRLAAEAPGDLNKVFFSCGGSESVETAWKVIKQYFRLIGKPSKTKVISRVRRVSRYDPRCDVDHRSAGLQASVRAAGARRLPGPEHQLLPRTQGGGGR